MTERAVLLKTDGSERVPYTDEIYPIYWQKDSNRTEEMIGTVAHWHDDIEMCVVTEGRLVYDINGKPNVLKKGDCVFVNARQLHRERVTGGDTCVFNSVIFHPSILTGANAAVDLCVHDILTHPNYPFEIFRAAREEDKRLIELITTLWRRASDTGPARMIGIAAAACELFYTLYPRLPERAEGKGEDKHLSTIRAMTGFIQSRYAEKITVADISRAGFVSERTADTLFKKWFSMTPLNYLTHYRLEKAIALLQTAQTPITDIALDTGFSDANYFAICFRKRFGMSPTEYRKRKTSV